MKFILLLANVPILYPLKTQKNKDVFGGGGGDKMGWLARNGLMANQTLVVLAL